MTLQDFSIKLLIVTEAIKSRTIIYPEYMTGKNGILHVPHLDIFIPNTSFFMLLLKLEDKDLGKWQKTWMGTRHLILNFMGEKSIMM